MELGTVYTENPLHGQLTVPNNHLDAGDSDTLLTSIQATVQEQKQRVDQQEERSQEQAQIVRQQQIVVRQIRDALEALTRQIGQYSAFNIDEMPRNESNTL